MFVLARPKLVNLFVMLGIRQATRKIHNPFMTSMVCRTCWCAEQNGRALHGTTPCLFSFLTLSSQEHPQPHSHAGRPNIEGGLVERQNSRKVCCVGCLIMCKPMSMCKHHLLRFFFRAAKPCSLVIAPYNPFSVKCRSNGKSWTPGRWHVCLDPCLMLSIVVLCSCVLTASKRALVTNK